MSLTCGRASNAEIKVKQLFYNTNDFACVRVGCGLCFKSYETCVSVLKDCLSSETRAF